MYTCSQVNTYLDPSFPLIVFTNVVSLSVLFDCKKEKNLQTRAIDNFKLETRLPTSTNYKLLHTSSRRNLLSDIPW